jgi:hypothetical protein
VTYYTIPYKQDGSCCPVCGKPETPCECPECECADLTGLSLGITVSAGFGGGPECTPVLFEGPVACPGGGVNETWTPACCIGDPPRQQEPLVIQIHTLNIDPCEGDFCTLSLSIDGTPYVLGTPYYGPNLDSDASGTPVVWSPTISIFCWDGEQLIACGSCSIDITINIEPCAEVTKWYCFQVVYTGPASSPDPCPPVNCSPWPTMNPAQVPQPTSLCAGLPATIAATLPACVSGAEFTPPLSSGCYWTEIIDGPFDTPAECDTGLCPKWYCMKVEEFEIGTECTIPKGTPPSYFCVQFVPWMVLTQFPQCDNSGFSTAYRRTIISGPYDTQVECSAVCGVCCNPALKYGVGSKLTGTKKAWLYAPAGAGNYAEITYDLTWDSGSTFKGKRTTKLTTYMGAGGMACYSHGTVDTVTTYVDDPWSATWHCDPATLLYYADGIISLGSAISAGLPNCGQATSCVNGANLTICTASYGGSCCGISYSYHSCTQSWLGPPTNCTGAPQLIQSYKEEVSVSISCLT